MIVADPVVVFVVILAIVLLLIRQTRQLGVAVAVALLVWWLLAGRV